MRRFLFVVLTLGLFIALTLAGCETTSLEPSSPDQCLRAQLFHECLARVPKGPESTHYSGWEHVVDECQTASYYQSIRLRKAIPLECRP